MGTPRNPRPKPPGYPYPYPHTYQPVYTARITVEEAIAARPLVPEEISEVTLLTHTEALATFTSKNWWPLLNHTLNN